MNEQSESSKVRIGQPRRLEELLHGSVDPKGNPSWAAGIRRSNSTRILAACFALGCSGRLFGRPNGLERVLGLQNRVVPRLFGSETRSRSNRENLATAGAIVRSVPVDSLR